MGTNEQHMGKEDVVVGTSKQNLGKEVEGANEQLVGNKRLGKEVEGTSEQLMVAAASQTLSLPKARKARVNGRTTQTPPLVLCLGGAAGAHVPMLQASPSEVGSQTEHVMVFSPEEFQRFAEQKDAKWQAFAEQVDAKWQAVVEKFQDSMEQKQGGARS